MNKAQTCHAGPVFQARVHFGSSPNVAHSPSPLFEKLERNQSSASPQAVCHFLPSPSLTLSTEETFQINVFSSLKTFSQTFHSGKGSISSGNGQAHVGTEWSEKGKKKKSNLFSSSGQCAASLKWVFPRSWGGFFGRKKQSQWMKIICSCLFCKTSKGIGELGFHSLKKKKKKRILWEGAARNCVPLSCFC